MQKYTLKDGRELKEVSRTYLEFPFPSADETIPQEYRGKDFDFRMGTLDGKHACIVLDVGGA